VLKLIFEYFPFSNECFAVVNFVTLLMADPVKFLDGQKVGQAINLSMAKA
jgi:hypothetical protein